MVYVVNGVLASGVDMLLEKDLAGIRSMFEEFRERQQAANLSTHTPEPSQLFNFICYDDEEIAIPLNKIVSQLPPSIDEFIKSSVENFVPIPSESKDTSDSDSDCDLPSCDDFSAINVYEEKSITFSKPLFDSNDDFTSSDDESLSDEDIPEDNFKIYSNPLFEFDDEYISSDVNPLFDEGKSVTFSNPLFDSNDDFASSDDESLSDEDVLEDNVKIYSNPLFKFDDEYISSDVNPFFNEVLENIESKESYVSNFDASRLLILRTGYHDLEEI
ncbi:hypothetical protein Tco_0559317 [Tanacetum coccineum]